MGRGSGAKRLSAGSYGGGSNKGNAFSNNQLNSMLANAKNGIGIDGNPANPFKDGGLESKINNTVYTLDLANMNHADRVEIAKMLQNILKNELNPQKKNPIAWVPVSDGSAGSTKFYLSSMGAKTIEKLLPIANKSSKNKKLIEDGLMKIAFWNH